MKISVGLMKKAGGENRTRVISLEGWGFTTKLHPQNKSQEITQNRIFCQLLLNDFKQKFCRQSNLA
jgi:hypothetical protein